MFLLSAVEDIIAYTSILSHTVTTHRHAHTHVHGLSTKFCPDYTKNIKNNSVM